MKIFLILALLLLSYDSFIGMEKPEKGLEDLKKIIEKASKVTFRPSYVNALPALSREESDRMFQESMYRKHGRKILQNVCPLELSQVDNPELFNRQPGEFPDSKSFFDARNRLLTIVKSGDNHELIDSSIKALALNTVTQKVFLTHVDLPSNTLIVLKSDKTEPYSIPWQKSLLQIVDLATGDTLSEAKYEMPYGINNVAYDHEHKRVYLATAMLAFGGDSAAGLWKIDQTSEKADWIASDSIGNSFTYLACLPNQSLLTVQGEGLIKEWDVSQADHPRKTLWMQPLDARFESLLPGEPIHADLSADKKGLLVGVCQPYSRFFILDLEKAREQENEIKLKRIKGQEANPRYYFSHDILDTNDSRPTTALKLLSCKTKFVAVRAALKKKMPLYPIHEKKDPVDYTVQLWSFDGDFYHAAPLAEFSVHQSPVLCKELSIAPDDSRVAENNIIWDISLLSRLKEILKKDLIKTADEYDALTKLDTEEDKKIEAAMNSFEKNPSSQAYAKMLDAIPTKNLSSIAILSLLKRLDAFAKT